MAVVFVVCCAFCFYKVNLIYLNQKSSFKSIVNSTLQDNLTYKNLINSKNEKPKQESLFKTAAEAIMFSTAHLKERSSFYVLGKGTVTTTAGIKVVVESEEELWQFDNKNMYHSLETLQTSGINMGQTGAALTYVKNGNTYKKTTKSVYKNSNSLYSNFNGSFTPVASNSIILLPYVFNKNTIIKTSDLIIKRDLTGNISGYLIDFNLSPNIGTQEYAEIIKENTGGMAKSLPVFSTIKMHIQLDANGVLQKLQSYEVCTMDVGINATLTNNFTYIFKSLEEAPTLTLPNL